MATIDEVKRVLKDVLQLGDKADGLSMDSTLLGGIPEFDSMAVVGVVTTLEETYGFTVEDDEIDAEVFETVGSLVEFVDKKLNS
ncbi:MAG: phosphopantetheine-binding protein [Gammaproteobacteria bacterium]|nr:acyl carrier protein [Pseudomonadales bacterium]